MAEVTDDEITDLVILHATSPYRYGPEEFSYVVAGAITEHLAIDDEDIDCELVEEWLRQFRLAVTNTTGYARAIAQRRKDALARG